MAARIGFILFMVYALGLATYIAILGYALEDPFLLWLGIVGDVVIFVLGRRK